MNNELPYYLTPASIIEKKTLQYCIASMIIRLTYAEKHNYVIANCNISCNKFFFNLL